KKEVQLVHPDVLAAGVSEQILRPWKFRMMREWLGISDDHWSLIMQIAGFVIAFIMGFRSRRRSPLAAAAFLGFVINMIAQIFIAGGGPGAFVGFAALPLLCILSACLGMYCRSLAYRDAALGLAG